MFGRRKHLSVSQYYEGGSTTKTETPRNTSHHTVEHLRGATSKKKLVNQVCITLSERVISKLSKNKVLDDYPPPINDEETLLKRSQRTTLSQLRSRYCRLLRSYKHRLDDEMEDSCLECGTSPHDVRHLFNCPAHHTILLFTYLKSLVSWMLDKYNFLIYEISNPKRLRPKPKIKKHCCSYMLIINLH